MSMHQTFSTGLPHLRQNKPTILLAFVHGFCFMLLTEFLPSLPSLMGYNLEEWTLLTAFVKVFYHSSRAQTRPFPKTKRLRKRDKTITMLWQSFCLVALFLVRAQSVFFCFIIWHRRLSHSPCVLGRRST